MNRFFIMSLLMFSGCFTQAMQQEYRGQHEEELTASVQAGEAYIKKLEEMVKNGQITGLLFKISTVIDEPIAKFKDQVLSVKGKELYDKLISNQSKAHELGGKAAELVVSQSSNQTIEETLRPITQEERDTVLKGIKAIDTNLYNAIIEVDPTGKDHITRTSGSSSLTVGIAPSRIDGLPEFYIGFNFTSNPWNEMLFLLAHEMSHYVLGHFFEQYTASHKELEAKEIAQKAKIITGNLPFHETFADSRQRIKENECDRMAVIDFGINLDDAIKLARRGVKEEEEDKLTVKNTFKRSHPLFINRLKYLESLHSEVELKKTRKAQAKVVNWKYLAEGYLQKYGGPKRKEQPIVVTPTVPPTIKTLKTRNLGVLVDLYADKELNEEDYEKFNASRSKKEDYNDFNDKTLLDVIKIRLSYQPTTVPVIMERYSASKEHAEHLSTEQSKKKAKDFLKEFLGRSTKDKSIKLSNGEILNEDQYPYIVDIVKGVLENKLDKKQSDNNEVRISPAMPTPNQSQAPSALTTLKGWFFGTTH